MPHRIIHPDGWKPAKGYANGMLTETGTLYIGGQIGWTADQIFESHDFIGQMEQALLNIRAVLEAAGGTPQDLVRLTWYVTDKRDYVARQGEIGEAYRRVLGRHFPAMTMVVVSALVEDEAVVEIEATAELGMTAVVDYSGI
ncbi:RidA family protein [Thalassococcus sp. S3]|uniref:RidA family protein n=1 Tax=Thalassococcus sp. S3 TaxID=2017482 RepID=UPI0010241E6C|nr:RidA family protein [Thalassococcus sp. S3]QBF33011.1 enamine deaminase RidA [Thalassococcus sp. S3]